MNGTIPFVHSHHTTIRIYLTKQQVMNENELFFWKDGDYNAMDGFFVRSDLKTFINKLIEAGHEPVGIKIDLDSFNLEVLVKAK